ncbi:MAG: adenine deaminase [Candidatus Thermoplasmatota archaeon]|jgi:adenine deaminase|nr:adenine deaminase [Candidatus Thermoplasmatota archaeon]
MKKEISGNIVDLINQKIFPGTIKIENGKISEIVKKNQNLKNYIIPGFVDAHIHIESSMLTPSEFARVAVIHGTVAAVADPHEIANVLGIKGVSYMINNASKVVFKFYFGAPSCVPASSFETTGGVITTSDVETLLKRNDIKFLAEMMNYPGVIYDDSEVMKKIAIAKKYSKPIDGHAPGLTGEKLKKYVSAGIITDHESSDFEEAYEKIKLGMKILIREGSAAKNLQELIPLLENYWQNCMFCSDDKHPDDLVKGHINLMVKKALENKIDPMKVLIAASLNPVKHYNLDVGLLREGDFADFLVIDDLDKLNVISTIINGVEVAKSGKTLMNKVKSEKINKFNIKKLRPNDFALSSSAEKMNVIVAIDSQIFTEKIKQKPKIENGYVVSDVDNDILKISIINRYKKEKPSIAFIKNFGLKDGAIASSVAHDSHNIIAVGVTDEYICKAVNLIIKNKGGISAVGKNFETVLPLPIAGIMSDKSYDQVAKKYIEINNAAISLGTKLKSPFMSLSFMALPVIPKLKITDKGLFDSEKFKFINLFED